MLKKSLIAQTAPIANAANVVTWKDYRVTVLQDRLFRMEKSPAKQFRDDATQAVWFRNMQPQNFTFTDNGNTAVIDTGVCRLILASSRTACRVELNGKSRKINNSGNLKGTARTLDLCDGDAFFHNYHSGDWKTYKKLKLDNGVCSRTGIAVFDDAASLSLGGDGEIKNVQGNGTDEYIFAYGADFRGAVKALYLITGATPKIPRYALGNWWSRYHDYTDKEYLTLLTGFEEREVPLTVATIDMDWHYSGDLSQQFDMEQKGRTDPYYGGTSGWTGYSWNKRLFPDYRAFLKEIQARNLKITLNLHPADGVRWFEDVYPQMAKTMGIDPESGEPVKFDITDPDFINAYFDIIHKPYEADGVGFWWIDWQQGFTTAIDGLDPLWSLNHYHYLDSGENHAPALILSRYAGVGSHRYPLGFSGDTFVSWKTLRYLPYYTANASNVGYTWWSHDIGGHMWGEQDNEMYLRHVQYGVFSPINRLHCSDMSTMTKEPWAYENGTGKVAEDFLRLRHAMIPFLYTQSYRTHKDGKALVEPLYYHWNCQEAFESKDAYLFGDLLVAPVLTRTQKDGYARVNTWLPEGQWTDIFTGDCYFVPAGGRRVTLMRHLESIPVLAKAGTVLPLSMDKGNSSDNPHKLELRVFSGDGDSFLYEDGTQAQCHGEAFTHMKTSLTVEKMQACQSLEIYTEGSSNVLPADRVLRVSFQDIPEGRVTVYKNGKHLDAAQLYTQCAAVEFPYDANGVYRVEVVYEVVSQTQALIDRAKQVLLRAEDMHKEKCMTFQVIQQAADLADYCRIVTDSSLRSATKQRLLETAAVLE